MKCVDVQFSFIVLDIKNSLRTKFKCWIQVVCLQQSYSQDIYWRILLNGLVFVCNIWSLNSIAPPLRIQFLLTCHAKWLYNKNYHDLKGEFENNYHDALSLYFRRLIRWFKRASIRPSGTLSKYRSTRKIFVFCFYDLMLTSMIWNP